MPSHWLPLVLAQIILISILFSHTSFASQEGQIIPHSQTVAIEPPLKQMEVYGVSINNITCSPGMILMKSAFDGSPACVTPATAQKLVERGWGAIVPRTGPAAFVSSANYTVGQKVGVFTISRINQDNVTGYYNNPYPVARPGPGVPTTMHVNDILNPTCDGSAPLVITAINYPDSITVSKGISGGAPVGRCPICLSASSVIDTPTGKTNIRMVRDGMTVWSINQGGAIVRAEVVKTGNVYVGHAHKVVDLRLADGRELFASPNHPTYDGREIKDLKAGERYDGSTVVSTDLVPYNYTHTYDILPDTVTGDYFADGILVGSTLK